MILPMGFGSFNLFSKEILTTEKLVWAVNVLLFFSVMYIGGMLTGGIIHDKILNTSVSVPPLKIPPKQPLSKDPGIPRNEFITILDRNIFNAKRKAEPVPLRPPPSDKIITENPSQKPPPAPTSKLKIELRGTIVTSSKKNTYAFFARKNGSKVKIFGLEECFTPSKLEKDRECTPENVKVIEIKKQKVRVTYQGKQEWLDLKEGPKSKTTVASASRNKLKAPKRNLRITKKVKPPKRNLKKTNTPLPAIRKPLKDSEEALVQQEATEMNVQREWVDEQLANFSNILQDARIDATTKNGKTYFQFKMIKSGSMYETLGLQKGDIIISVNNVIIDNLPKAISLLQKFQSEREIALVINRGEVRQTIRYIIN